MFYHQVASDLAPKDGETLSYHVFSGKYEIRKMQRTFSFCFHVLSSALQSILFVNDSLWRRINEWLKVSSKHVQQGRLSTRTTSKCQLGQKWPQLCSIQLHLQTHIHSHTENIRERSSVKYRVLNVHVESQGIFSFYRITISVNL